MIKADGQAPPDLPPYPFFVFGPVSIIREISNLGKGALDGTSRCNETCPLKRIYPGWVGADQGVASLTDELARCRDRFAKRETNSDSNTHLKLLAGCLEQARKVEEPAMPQLVLDTFDKLESFVLDPSHSRIVSFAALYMHLQKIRTAHAPGTVQFLDDVQRVALNRPWPGTTSYSKLSSGYCVAIPLHHPAFNAHALLAALNFCYFGRLQRIKANITECGNWTGDAEALQARCSAVLDKLKNTGREVLVREIIRCKWRVDSWFQSAPWPRKTALVEGDPPTVAGTLAELLRNADPPEVESIRPPSPVSCSSESDFSEAVRVPRRFEKHPTTDTVKSFSASLATVGQSLEPAMSPQNIETDSQSTMEQELSPYKVQDEQEDTEKYLMQQLSPAGPFNSSITSPEPGVSFQESTIHVRDQQLGTSSLSDYESSSHRLGEGEAEVVEQTLVGDGRELRKRAKRPDKNKRQKIAKKLQKEREQNITPSSSLSMGIAGSGAESSDGGLDLLREQVEVETGKGKKAEQKAKRKAKEQRRKERRRIEKEQKEEKKRMENEAIARALKEQRRRTQEEMEMEVERRLAEDQRRWEEGKRAQEKQAIRWAEEESLREEFFRKMERALLETKEAHHTAERRLLKAESHLQQQEEALCRAKEEVEEVQHQLRSEITRRRKDEETHRQAEESAQKQIQETRRQAELATSEAASLRRELQEMSRKTEEAVQALAEVKALQEIEVQRRDRRAEKAPCRDQSAEGEQQTPLLGSSQTGSHQKGRSEPDAAERARGHLLEPADKHAQTQAKLTQHFLDEEHVHKRAEGAYVNAETASRRALEAFREVEEAFHRAADARRISHEARQAAIQSLEERQMPEMADRADRDEWDDWRKEYIARQTTEPEWDPRYPRVAFGMSSSLDRDAFRPRNP